jgi:hypothetical protein
MLLPHQACWWATCWANVLQDQLWRKAALHVRGYADRPCIVSRSSRLYTTIRPACLQVGQLFMGAGQPGTFQLNYRWPHGSSADRPMQPATFVPPCPQPQPPHEPPAQWPSAKRKLDVEQPESLKRAASGVAAPVAAAAAAAVAAHTSAAHISRTAQLPGYQHGALTPAGTGASAAPGLQAANPSGQHADDGLFGMAWPPPSLLVTPSLLEPPTSSPPEQPPPRSQATAAAGAAPTSAVTTAMPPPVSFLPLSAGAGAAASAAVAGPVPAVDAAAPHAHSNWGGSLAGLLAGPRVNEFGLEESCDAFAAGWGHGTRPHNTAGMTHSCNQLPCKLSV